ncbi:MAG TPA: hypothetical protein VFZ69_15790 [Longimicrobiales bacterium]
MRTGVLMTAAVIALAGCGSTLRTTVPAQSAPASVSTDREDRTERSNGNGRGERARGPRHLNGVPPGHYPKPGQCRLWYSGKPPGQQPRPTSCSSLVGRGRVPSGAFILYGDRAFDADYDWVAESRKRGVSVPEIIVEIIRSRS